MKAPRFGVANEPLDDGDDPEALAAIVKGAPAVTIGGDEMKKITLPLSVKEPD